MSCTRHDDLLRREAGLLSAERVASVDEHLRTCSDCARTWSRLQATTRRLRPDPGEFDDPALADEVLTLVRLGRDPSSTGRPWSWRPLAWLMPAVGLVAVAGLVLMLAWPPVESAPDGFQARSGPPDPDRWVSVQAFQADPMGGYRSLGDRLRASDTLAFSYLNRTAVYDHLMVLAVDEGGQVYWYYPAHTRPAEDPESVPIRSAQNPIELPDQVRHPLAPGTLRLFALFSKGALRVKAVESQVARDLRAAGSLQALERLNLEGTGQHSRLLTVEPEG